MTSEQWLKAPNQEFPNRTNIEVLAETMYANGGFLPNTGTEAGDRLLAMQHAMGTEITIDPNDQEMSTRVMQLINDQLLPLGTTFTELMAKDMQK